MTYRVPDSFISLNFASQINTHRSRISVLQERLTTGRRINRPSDDPVGAGVVLNIKTSQSQIDQLKRNAEDANLKLSIADGALDNFTDFLEQVRTKVSQGFNNTSSPQEKEILAVEVESLRNAILNLANTQAGTEYVFGGIRQGSPPFDEVTATPNPNPTVARYVQVEPGANAIAIGVIAEDVFVEGTSNIFADIDNAITALRGTGDDDADLATLEAMVDRLSLYSDKSAIAQARIGGNMELTNAAKERLAVDSLNLDAQINTIETADFTEDAIDFAEAQNALNASLQVAASRQRNLLDFLG